MNIIESFIAAFKYTFLYKKFYRKLFAYGCTIGGMKYEGNEELPVEEWKPNDKYWRDELPSIYDLDIITKEMNSQCNDIKKTFKLDVDAWDRDEVRNLMNSFEKVHNDFCHVNKKDLSIIETCVKISMWLKRSFWQNFKMLRNANQMV